LGQQALTSMGKRRGGASRLETGTARNTGNVSDDGIDYDWLPKETLNGLSKYIYLFMSKMFRVF